MNKSEVRVQNKSESIPSLDSLFDGKTYTHRFFSLVTKEAGRYIINGELDYIFQRLKEVKDLEEKDTSDAVALYRKIFEVQILVASFLNEDYGVGALVLLRKSSSQVRRIMHETIEELDMQLEKIEEIYHYVTFVRGQRIYSESKRLLKLKNIPKT